MAFSMAHERVMSNARLKPVLFRKGMRPTITAQQAHLVLFSDAPVGPDVPCRDHGAEVAVLDRHRWTRFERVRLVTLPQALSWMGLLSDRSTH